MSRDPDPVLPAVLGVASIMSDRSPGLREHQMTAPVSTRAQSNMKLIVCLGATSLVLIPLSFIPTLLTDLPQLRGDHHRTGAAGYSMLQLPA